MNYSNEVIYSVSSQCYRFFKTSSKINVPCRSREVFISCPCLGTSLIGGFTILFYYEK